MRTLHFNPLSNLHKPQWLHFNMHVPRVLREPWFWAAVIFISLIAIASLLAIFGPANASYTMPYPYYYP